MNKKQIIYFIIISLIELAVGLYVISTIPPSTDLTPYEYEVKALKTLLDTNTTKINRLDTKAVYWEEYAKKQDTIINTQQNKIERLTKDVNKKIKAVDNMSTTDLYNSITSRYK